jgi:hypothetical protein
MPVIPVSIRQLSDNGARGELRYAFSRKRTADPPRSSPGSYATAAATFWFFPAAGSRQSSLRKPRHRLEASSIYLEFRYIDNYIETRDSIDPATAQTVALLTRKTWRIAVPGSITTTIIVTGVGEVAGMAAGRSTMANSACSSSR